MNTDVRDLRLRYEAGASTAEQTAPSSPQSAASRASRKAMLSGVSAKPISATSLALRLVNTVTAISKGRGADRSAAVRATDSRAATSIARPPAA